MEKGKENCFFRVIKTENPNADTAQSEHQQKLENFRKYNYPASDADMRRMATPMQPIPYRLEIYGHSTSITVKNHNFVILTTLYCEKESVQTHNEELRAGYEH